jgi:hypothetical protein
MKKFRIITALLLMFTMMFNASGFVSFAHAAEAAGYINIFYKTSEDETKCVWKAPVYEGEPVFLTDAQVKDFDSEKEILLSVDTYYGVVVTKYDEARDASYGASGPADPDSYLSSLSSSDIYYSSESYINANEYFFEDDMYEESEGESGSSLSGSIVFPGVKEVHTATFVSSDATSEEYTNPVNGYKSRIFTGSVNGKEIRFVLSTDYKNEESSTVSDNIATVNTATMGSYYIEVLGEDSIDDSVAIHIADATNPKYDNATTPFDNNRVYIGGMSSVADYMVYFCPIKHIAQTVSVTPTTKTIKYSKLKKKKQTFTIKSKNDVFYTYQSLKEKYISVNYDGKVHVKKKTPKGTYKIKVHATKDISLDEETMTLLYYDYASKVVKVKVK